MRGELLPLFPLQTVLLPHATLPLRIFEERYKEMIRELLPARGEFGVVLARDNGVLNTGCTAAVAQVLCEYEDGRIDLVAVGGRRFRLRDLNTDRSFLRGIVEEFDDDDFSEVNSTRLREALALHRDYASATGHDQDPPDAAAPELSFLLADISPDLEFRQLLLGTLSEARRIELVANHLDQLLKQHGAQESMRATARSNGHGKHWKE